MAQEPIATKGNYLHIYDFRVMPGHEEEFVESFEEFDYSDGNPMHKSSAQVKDGVLCRDVEDPQRFYLIAEWSDIEEHAKIRKILANEIKPEFIKYIEGGKFIPKYVEVVSSTPDEILQKAARRVRADVTATLTFFRSSTSYRLRIALAYKRLAYEPHYVSLPKMEHRIPSYRDIIRRDWCRCSSRTAALIQSMAVIEYLDEVYPEPPLMPKDPHGAGLCACGLADHRLRHSSAQQRAGIEASEGAIRRRRGRDQRLVRALDH